MKKPTLFLSSTIYDFADLRSALKDYLELRGCKVLASEFTDFAQPLDKHSYEACLATIEQADFFVLFIGRRVGGWFDEPNQISITRAEYLRAYELAKAGRIRILCFVRSDVWNHRQSVRDFAKALKAAPELDEQQREKLVSHPTLAMDNAQAIISFIDEVTRNNETAKAARGSATAPIANWIWPFTTFGQVRQAIDPLVLSGLTVKDAAGRRALEAQLYTMLQGVLPKVNEAAFNPISSVLDLRTSLNLRSEHLINSSVRLQEKTWNKLGLLIVYAMYAKVDPSPIQAHLSSGMLLDYDAKAGTYHRTQEYDLLARVIQQASLLDMSGTASSFELLKYGKESYADGIRSVPGSVLIACMHRLLRWVDFIQSARALARSLAGKPPTIHCTVPITPIIDQETQLAVEAVSLDQVQAFVID